MPELVVVGGVSGSGKSTVGALLAQRLGVPFVDADSLHPKANIAKMAAGTPLDDDDRAPWLARIGEVVVEHQERGVVVACSALRRVYRDVIRSAAPSVRFVALRGSRDLVASRIAARGEHFMPASLLSSQLAAYEPLEADELGVDIDVDAPVDEVVAQAELTLRARA